MKKVKKLPIKLNEVKVKEIDFRSQKVVSFTQFSSYQQCPKQWAGKYVYKLAKNLPSINFIFGTAIHETLQLYIKTIYEESGAAADRLELTEIFQDKLIEQYKKEFDKNNSVHFSTPGELREFSEDGEAILTWLKKHRPEYFSVKNTYLVGIEMPVQKEVAKGVIFTGSIDLVLYESNINKIKIYDFKTSTKGWNDFNKKDDTKAAQIIIYKKYFSELYGFPVEDINVEFFILKRKVEPNEFQEFPKRVQTFSPASGKIKLASTLNNFESFLTECFDQEGKPIKKEYVQNIGPLCKYCPFYLNKEYCGVGL